MAAPTKKRAEIGNVENIDDDVNEPVDSDNASDGCEEEDMDGQDFINQEIKVDFEARNLEDSDFHGVRKLLSQLYLKANVDLSELTDTLISQNYIGSAIKQVEFDEDEDEDTGMDLDEDSSGQVFGIISVLNLTERKELKCVQEIKSMLLDRCSDCAKKNELADILNDPDRSLGLIINERFINIPPQLSVPSFNCLWKEIEHAKQKKMKYNFTDFIMLSKACSLSVQGVGSQANIKTFINAEEQLFHDACSISCEYSVQAEHDGVIQGTWDMDDEEMEPLRIVMVISADRINAIMEKMKEAYG